MKADLTDFNKGVDEAKHKANGLGTHLAGVGDSIANLGRQAAIFTGIVAGGLALVAKQGISAAAEFEQYDVAFNTLLKDRVKAQKVLKQIEEDAKKTPFELAPLVKANQLLISAGVSSENARVDIINLGNAIAATGGSQADLSRLAVNLQQIKAVGKASALDIKQFAFAGINVYDLLAKSMGKNVAEIKDMEIGYDDLTTAFAKASAKGGLFEGALEAQSKTFNGMISTLKDTIKLGLKDVFVNSGIFDVLKSGLEKLIPFLEVAARKIVEFVNNLKANEQFQEFVKKLVDAFRLVSDWVSENQELVITFLKGLAIAVGALLIIGTVTALIAAITNPLVLVAAAITLLFTAWQTNFLGIRDITMAVVEQLKLFFENVLLPIITVVRDWIVLHWEDIMHITEALWKNIVGTIQIAWAIIYGIFAVGLALLKGDWQGAWDALKNAASIGWSGIKNIFESVLLFIRGWGGLLVGELTKPFNEAWDKISEKVRQIKDALDFTKRHSPSVVDIVTKGVKEVNRAMQGLELSASITPHAAAAVVGNGGSTSVANISIDMAGAVISDELAAMRIGEKIGDQIIKKLQLNVRF